MSFHRRLLAGLALLGAFALISVPIGNAQAPPPARMGRGMMGPGSMGMGMTGMAGLPGQINAPIPDKPFTATAEVTYGQGQTSTVQLARDADGRTYLKTTLPPQPAGRNGNASATDNEGSTVIVIADPVAHRHYVIYPAAKNIEVRPLRRGGRGGMQGMARGMTMMNRAQATTTTLGTETIAGQPATGLKTVRNVPARGNQAATTATREVWRSEALQLVLKASNTGLADRETGFTVQSLHTGAPEASLFQLPSGYTLHMASAGRGARGRGTAPGAFRGGLQGRFRENRRGPAIPPPATGGQ